MNTKTNETLAQIDKRINRGPTARKLEDAGTWIATHEYGSREIRHPFGIFMWLAVSVATPTVIVQAFMNRESQEWNWNITLWMIAGTILMLLNIYYTIIPAVVRRVYAPVRELEPSQKEAVEEYEALAPEDRGMVRDALYEFLDTQYDFNETKFNHKKRLFNDTITAVTHKNTLTHKLELQAPSEAERTLEALQSRNEEIQKELA